MWHLPPGACKDAAMADPPTPAQTTEVDRTGRGVGAHLAVATGYGAVAGIVGGVGVLLLLMSVSLVMSSELRDGRMLLLLLYTAGFAATLGLLFGTATGFVGGMLSLPWRRRPEAMAAHAWIWALAKGGVVIALVALWGDGLPATSPASNETMQHVVEDWAIGVVGPGGAAVAATWWAACSLAALPTPSPRPVRPDGTRARQRSGQEVAPEDSQVDQLTTTAARDDPSLSGLEGLRPAWAGECRTSCAGLDVDDVGAAGAVAEGQ